jgi:hypothetical protein
LVGLRYAHWLVSASWLAKARVPPKPIIDRPTGPNAHISWAASIDEPADTTALALREVLSCWFGTPLNTRAVCRRRRRPI